MILETSVPDLYKRIHLIRERIEDMRKAGEGPGHPFRGNQYTSGSGGLRTPDRPIREQVVRNRVASGQGMPREAKAYRSNYRGFDPTADYGGQQGHHVFEFQDEKGMNLFLNDVGGAPHPLGGLRTVLSDRKRTR